MQLILRNGYPYPMPDGFNSDDYDCRKNSVVIGGVRHFEWKYELTVEFDDYATAKKAHKRTGWPWWGGSESRAILAPPYSREDGYETPAIIMGDKAYCGFILVE